MKVIGLIGGMSWESSLDYYKIINQTVRTELGGQHSAKILMYSVDFDEIERLQHEDRWDETVNILIDAGRRVENGGADFILLCTNTMHKVRIIPVLLLKEWGLEKSIQFDNPKYVGSPINASALSYHRGTMCRRA